MQAGATCKQCGKPFDERSGRCLASDGSKTICRLCSLDRKDRPAYHLCLMCNTKKSYHLFESRYRGYDIADFRMICKDCSPTFKRLPTIEAMEYIRLACLRYYGEKHYVYTLMESDTTITRYVGRTKYPNRRMQQHLRHMHDETYTEAMQKYTMLPEETRAGVAPPRYQEGYNVGIPYKQKPLDSGLS